MVIRAESPADATAVCAVNVAAFEGPAEADLVERLREQACPLVSLVADDGGSIVGHIMFSPATLLGHPEVRVIGLAPMAVLPGRQRGGIGSALVRAGLDACRGLGFDAVIVLGHPGFYPRFGFVPASRFGIRSEYNVRDDVFMALELQPATLEGKPGTMRYHPAFAEL